jgi:hypothetical protein
MKKLLLRSCDRGLVLVFLSSSFKRFPLFARISHADELLGNLLPTLHPLLISIGSARFSYLKLNYLLL